GHDHVEAVGTQIDGRNDIGNLAGHSTSAADGGDAAGLHRERRAAAAGRRGVGIANDELRAFDVLFVVDLGARGVLDAHRVDEQGDAAVPDLRVALVQVPVEREAVLEPRAAAALHEHAQLEVRIGFLTDQLADLGGRGGGEDQAGRAGIGNGKGGFSAHGATV